MGFMSEILCNSVILYLVHVWTLLWSVYVYVFWNKKILEINQGQLNG
jgi:hypothetical protein